MNKSKEEVEAGLNATLEEIRKLAVSGKPLGRLPLLASQAVIQQAWLTGHRAALATLGEGFSQGDEK